MSEALFITPEAEAFMTEHPFVIVTIWGFRVLYRTPIFWRNLVLLIELGFEAEPCLTMADLETCDVRWHETEAEFIRWLREGGKV